MIHLFDLSCINFCINRSFTYLMSGHPTASTPCSERFLGARNGGGSHLLSGNLGGWGKRVGNLGTAWTMQQDLPSKKKSGERTKTKTQANQEGRVYSLAFAALSALRMSGPQGTWGVCSRLLLCVYPSVTPHAAPPSLSSKSQSRLSPPTSFSKTWQFFQLLYYSTQILLFISIKIYPRILMRS